MLSQNEKEIIISKLPNIKLSYENIIHNKVCNFDYISYGRELFEKNNPRVQRVKVEII